MKNILFLLIILFSLTGFSQVKDTIPLSEKYILIKIGDTLTIDLDEVKLLPKTKFKEREDVNYYYWFRKKVFKAYPYAMLASKRLDTLNSRLLKIKGKRKKKKYIRVMVSNMSFITYCKESGVTSFISFTISTEVVYGAS